MLRELIARFGPLAIFFGAAVEGDATLVLAGVSAHWGLLGVGAAFLAGVLGTFAGDSVYFALGRRGAATIRGTATYRRVAPLVERLASRVGVVELLMARVVWGTRVASMVFWGVHGLPFARFAAVDLVGCAVWSATLVGLGFALSTTAEALLGEVRSVERWLLLALLVAGSLVLAGRALARRLGGGRAPTS